VTAVLIALGAIALYALGCIAVVKGGER